MLQINFEEDKSEPMLTKMTMTGIQGTNEDRNLMTDENVDAQAGGVRCQGRS